MDPNGSPNALSRLRQRHRRLAGIDVGPDRHDLLDTLRARPLDHGLEIVGEGSIVQVRVGIEQRHRRHTHPPSRASSSATMEESSFVKSGAGVASGVPGSSACTCQPNSSIDDVSPKYSFSRAQVNGR